MAVLDVGCGTGAITAGVAKAVGPDGRVVGIDRDESLLEIARRENGAIPNLRFERGDATALSFRSEFDIVTAARTLQWIAEPALAVRKMAEAAKPGGIAVVLDYSHAKNEWAPKPPEEFRRFYQAFLDWREANGWDNRMADHLPALFRSAGLVDVKSTVEDEVTERGELDFEERSRLWLEVIANVAEQLIQTGFSTATELHIAGERFAAWIKSDLQKQTLAMRSVAGRRVS